MKIIKKISKINATIDGLRLQGKTIGFTPTMGYLHRGHLSLINASKKQNDITVVSIFVNPAQFSKNEDLSKYPKDFERDKELLNKAKVDILFYPSEQEIYSTKSSINFIIDEELVNCMCGKSRPHHFPGVLLICSKLFNIIKPDNVYFGQKDFQQALIIKQMIKDLNFDIKMNIMPIVREKDGLAMSSRNVYLSPSERAFVPILKKSLDFIAEKIKNGEKNVKKLKNDWEKFLELDAKSYIVDYLDIRDKNNLSELKSLNKNSGIVLALAVKIGTTRLIDNIVL